MARDPSGDIKVEAHGQVDPVTTGEQTLDLVLNADVHLALRDGRGRHAHEHQY
jgi:hypothetical protein